MQQCLTTPTKDLRFLSVLPRLRNMAIGTGDQTKPLLQAGDIELIKCLGRLASPEEMITNQKNWLKRQQKKELNPGIKKGRGNMNQTMYDVLRAIRDCCEQNKNDRSNCDNDWELGYQEGRKELATELLEFLSRSGWFQDSTQSAPENPPATPKHLRTDSRAL